MRPPRRHLRDHASRGPEVQRATVRPVPEQQFRGPVGRGADVCDLLAGGLGRGVACHPGDAEVGDAGGAVGGDEEDVGGLDVAVDDAEGMDVGEAGEEVVEVGFTLLGGEGRVGVVVEERVEVEGQEGEDEGVFAAGEGEGADEGEDVAVRG